MANDLMRMRNDEQRGKITYHTNEEKIKAAYALNMCAVSVSQIVDYNDSYILEQEYDAILNNLNLKQMPKDEALLRILSELLNTITYFRIQEIKKQQIEKKYNQRIKNAIWSAVPSLSVVVHGDPVAFAISLATQIGTGYMNYRKEKNNALSDKEDAEIELEITAIEQLNSLKRELFTTAWRLADEYDFEDEWRITEKQIKQYNLILTDNDELRKYARLESIAKRFVAYPPFWYFYGHTAACIAESAKERISKNKHNTEEDRRKYLTDIAVFNKYRVLAKDHYEHYYSLTKYNILREDQLTASFSLEYIDILLEDDNKDTKKINELVRIAETMAPTSFDVIQLCVITYLKIGDTDNAARLLKILVNEEYNLSVNAKLLSRIYVSKYLFGDENNAREALVDYQILSEMADTVCLFPIPDHRSIDSKEQDYMLEKKYIEEQKNILQEDYRFAINEFIKANIIKYNKLWPVPYGVTKVADDYFDYSIESGTRRLEDTEKALDGNNKLEYIASLRDSLFRIRYLDLLNNVIHALDDLAIFRNSESREDLIQKIRINIVQKRPVLQSYQDKIENGSFAFEDYLSMRSEVSFQAFTEEFFDTLKNVIVNQLDSAEEVALNLKETTMKYLETAELDVIEFCRKQSLPDPEEMRKRNLTNQIDTSGYNDYFEYSILGEDIKSEEKRNKKRDKMKKEAKKYSSTLIASDSGEVTVLLPETDQFDAYFENVKLKGTSLKSNIFLIIDDRTKKDCDLLFAYDGFYIIKKNKIEPIRNYNRVRLVKRGNRDTLDVGWPDIFCNKNIDIVNLYNFIQKINAVR